MEREFGNYLSEGKGVARDEVKAVYWWERAAEKGSSFAQNSFAHALVDGRGVERNPVIALKWTILAAQKISGPSFGRIKTLDANDLKRHLTPTEIAFAQSEASTWLLNYQNIQMRVQDQNERECGIREFDKGAVR